LLHDDSEDKDEKKKNETIVLDIGTGYVKAGIMNDSKPEKVFPNMVANDGKYVGKEAFEMVGKKVYPMTKGEIKNWSAMTQVITYTLKESLKTAGKVMYTNQPFFPKHYMDFIAKMLFEEDLGITAFSSGERQQMALKFYGKETGLVVQSGHGKTSVVPIIEGKVDYKNIHTSFLAG